MFTITSPYVTLMFGLEHADNEEEQWSDDFVSIYFGLVGRYCGKK